MKIIRNVLSVLIGLITYYICEIIFTYIVIFLLKIPILSFLMTSYIPSDIFLSATVSCAAIFITFYIIKTISLYDSINYSVIIVFSLLAIAYIASFIYNISTVGFDFSELIPAAIYIGSLVFGCCMAKEEM